MQQEKKLKKQLFTEMKDLGLQSQLKKQIRVQLCQKLKAKQKIKDRQLYASHDDKLFTRVLVSMIGEELRNSGCQYTYSVYSAESGYDQKMLNRQEIMEVMGVEQSTQQHKYMNQKISIIANILKKKYPFTGGTYRHTSMQTNPQEIGYTLQQRLSKIDLQYRKNLIKATPQPPELQIKTKVQAIQSQLKRNYAKDILRFRQFEAHHIKVTVGEQWRKKFEQFSKKISQQYSRKMDHLRKKYKNIEQDLINRNKVFDQKSHTTTKTLNQKLELLELKSKTLDETKNNIQLERNRLHNQTKNRQKQLQNKIKQYDSLLLQINKKIEYQVNIQKLAIQQQYQEKQAQFLEKKKFIDEEYGKLMGIKDTVDVVKEQSRTVNDENIKLRSELTVLQQELRVSMSENGSKSDRIENLRAQISELKDKNAEISEKSQQQLKKRKKMQTNVTEMRKQLQQLRNWKQRNQSNLQSNNSEIRQDLPRIQQKTQLQIKMQRLKQQRKKQIQRLRLQL